MDSVYDMLDRMEKKTGVKITPHMLRHYFANMRKQAGWELEMISQALGHKHLDTTIKYLDWLDDELIEASNEFYASIHCYLWGGTSAGVGRCEKYLYIYCNRQNT